jgi:hypothetical protein
MGKQSGGGEHGFLLVADIIKDNNHDNHFAFVVSLYYNSFVSFHFLKLMPLSARERKISLTLTEY